MYGQSVMSWCERGCGTIPKRAFSSKEWSSVKSCVSWPDVVFIETRSLGASALKNRVAESRTKTASCMDMWTSSKTMETNLCGSAVAFTAVGSASEEETPGSEVVRGTVCVRGFSMANEVMV